MVKAARQRENTKEKRVISSKKATSNELLIRRSLVRVQQGEPKIDLPEYREPLYSGRSTPFYKRILEYRNLSRESPGSSSSPVFV